LDKNVHFLYQKLQIVVAPLKRYTVLNNYSIGCILILLPTKSTGEFEWDAQEQGVILGAFYYGLVFSLLPGGILAERYSAKWVIFISILGGTLCTFLSPLAARFGGYAAFVAVKVIQGFFQVHMS
jgi:MFS family permease